MGSVKASLHTTIESLSEREARQLMGIVRKIRSKKEAGLTLKRIALDPAFNVTIKQSKPFRAIQPIQGNGQPASKLLVEDRR